MCRAIIRVNKKYGFISVLCPIGHLIEAHRLDSSFGGSHFEAELAYRHEGDRFDRLAMKCDGAGHKPTHPMLGHNQGPAL